MGVIVLIAILVALVLIIILWIKHWLFVQDVLWQFKHCNVIVSGKKGTGKDLVFQYVINKRKEKYYANISYGGDYKNIKLKQVSCAPNDYEHIVNDNIVKQKHTLVEKKDIYISDIGVFLPSYMDSKLYKEFPSMPILYALSRHLYANNIHCNSQNVERGWKALREQADFYIITKRTYKIFGIFLTRCITYDKYESARQGLLPIKTRILNKYSKAEVDIYNAKNGNIKSGFIIQRKKDLKYDTRAFEKILLKGKRKLK